MPIPNTPNFERLLSSFSVTKPETAEGWREFVVVKQQSLYEDYEFKNAAAVTFWYRDDAGLSLESLLKKIIEELKKQGHVSNLELASVITALFAYTKNPAISAVERFNLVFDTVVNADVNQFFLLPQLALSTYRVEIGPFSIGPFNPEHLAYLSHKSGSDYYERYESGLRKIPFSVERKPRAVRVVYWHKLVGPNSQWVPQSQSKSVLSTLEYLVDQYFSNLAALYFADFFVELHRVQEVPMALGSDWFDLNKLREVLGSHQISVFLKIGGDNVGFVTPSASLVMNLNLGGGHVGLPFTEKYLQHHFGFTAFTDCEIHRSLQNFCHFLAMAAQHVASGRDAEAFLHHVIALDLLLGDAGSSTNSLSTRSAALVFRALNQDYQAVVKDLVRIYNARSKFVHEGKQPDLSLLTVVKKICREVAFCLFRLQQDEKFRVAGFHDRWLKDLDFVIAATEAGQLLNDADWQRVGAVVGDEVRSTAFTSELEHPLAPTNP